MLVVVCRDEEKLIAFVQTCLAKKKGEAEVPMWCVGDGSRKQLCQMFFRGN